MILEKSHPPDDNPLSVSVFLPAEDLLLPGFFRVAVKDHQVTIRRPGAIHVGRRLYHAVGDRFRQGFVKDLQLDDNFLRRGSGHRLPGRRPFDRPVLRTAMPFDKLKSSLNI